ncbi:DUF748 domain-containing protein [Uliginosibacterium gangwonense]|uniref:DUF748 domain-containing protein n=1 Tax=Uliginosibacterium gangwonense TaxID=392736 RepID=UPI00035EE3CA|nr:DUF748 domain-containing protein [Uliginosibacterium gangwonense]
MFSKKIVFRILIGSFLLVAALALAYGAALRLLKQQIVSALGPEGEVQSIEVSLHAIEIRGLRVKAGSALHKRMGWPAADELRADKVRVVPDLRSLLTDTVVVRSIDIDGGWLPMMRTTKGLQIVPGLHAPKNDDKEDADQSKPKAQHKISFGTIALHDSQIDFYDATVSHKPHLIPLRRIEAHLDDFHLPDMDEKSALDIQAEVGEHHPGRIALKGWLTPGNLDSQLKLDLKDVSLTLIEPYLVKAADTHVKRGSFSLELDSKVNERKLNAPGKLVLDHMELSGSGMLGGIARDTALALLRDRSEQIDLNFVLKGDLDDPKFSLNEEFYTRIGSALAETLGIGFESLGKGASSVTQGIGKAIKGLFN